ncbi:hypothetical protein [Paenibacillus sp. NPDC057934]|uniref:hypothetical protein n=1 Tax=Paenibacillus sp. NPDC057934 TaxID=3346282 RepID=UPI0036D7CC50
MSLSLWYQVAEVKARVLDLTNVLMKESEEVFNREMAILDLMDIAKDIYSLEEHAMKLSEDIDRKQITEIADQKDSLQQTKNAPGVAAPETFSKQVM